MTCLSMYPPLIDILASLKPNTGSMNSIHIGMMCSLVLMWSRVVKFSLGPRKSEGGVLTGIRESEGGVINIGAGLKESEGHNYIY